MSRTSVLMQEAWMMRRVDFGKDEFHWLAVSFTQWNEKTRKCDELSADRDWEDPSAQVSGTTSGHNSCIRSIPLALPCLL